MYNNKHIYEKEMILKMNNSVRRKQRITALSLVLTMLMGGCGGKQTSFFELVEK